MAHPLDSFRSKVNRAHAYLQALDREVEAWRARKPYEVFSQYDPGVPNYYYFRVRFFEGVPLEWGLLVGDIAHNMRSALDHLAYQIVLAGGGTPTVATQFPILLNPFDWPTGQGRDRLKGASDRHIEIVESFQPYHRLHSAGGYSAVWSSLRDPLAVLAFLNNEDKHRVLHGTPVAISSMGVNVYPVRDVDSILFDKIKIELGPLKDGEELVRVPIIPSGPNPELKLDRAETVDITFDQRVEFRGQAVFERPGVRLIEALEVIELKLWDLFEIFVKRVPVALARSRGVTTRPASFYGPMPRLDIERVFV